MSSLTSTFQGCSSVAQHLPVVSPRESVLLAAGLVDKYGRPIGGAKSKNDEKEAPSSAVRVKSSVNDRLGSALLISLLFLLAVCDLATNQNNQLSFATLISFVILSP